MEGHRRVSIFLSTNTINTMFQSLFLWKVIVEYTIWVISNSVKMFQSLFLWKVIVEHQRPATRKMQPVVSILVFMEGHRRGVDISTIGTPTICFNPCFYGRSS